MMTHHLLKQPYNGLMVSGCGLSNDVNLIFVMKFIGKEFCGTTIKVEQSMWYGKRKEVVCLGK